MTLSTTNSRSYKLSSYPPDPTFEALVKESNRKNANRNVAVILKAHESADPTGACDLRESTNQSFIERIRNTHRVVLVVMRGASISKALQKAKQLGGGGKITALCLSAHGNKNGWEFFAGKKYSIRNLSEEDFSLLEKGALVVSDSCGTGKKEGIAQQLSWLRPDLLVIAPSSTIVFQLALRKKNILHILQFNDQGKRVDYWYRAGRAIPRHEWTPEELKQHSIQLMKCTQHFGNICALGNVFTENPTLGGSSLGIRAFFQTARAGYLDAQFKVLNLGLEGVDAETEKEMIAWAVTLADEYERQGLSSKQGNMALRVGRMLEQSQNIEGNYLLAARWYEKSQELGDPLATTYLGRLHEHGLGVQRDVKKAEELYEEAAAAGSSDGKRLLEALRAKTPKVLTWDNL
jgi:hypothetical protein